ncbi:helix-hairpin-helix domain-containing protein [Aestuariibacter sp. AA17]|uniref:Helix-hairpin-helix domain-containing protein n=1 Tax=Fluctibacter corallii TaxID=2984329 RepID=A0ABT3A3N9_9ALTE|nr:helix-hairpin-helix domain-containing protein [Aestuariibacter sp. AA17]MCV2883268.1 helix-hairpin-helix domain-containing protein [Aestuariibacter sp. AA17]
MKFFIPFILALSCATQANFAYAKPKTLEEKVAAAQAIPSTININSASVDELTRLPGIGKSKAKAIIEYREANGKFDKVEELVKVKGIGVKMVAKLSSMASV